MLVVRCLPPFGLLAVLALGTGCAVVPSADWNTLKAENSALQEENRAQVARIRNLEIHSRSTEGQLVQAEEDLATLDEQHELSRKQLSNYRFERNQPNAQFQGALGRRWPVSPETSRRLAELSHKYPHLRLDPETGIAKFDTDILFDTGTSDLKPAAERALTQLVAALKTPEARDLKVLVVGHTDDRPVARRPARDKYHNNFHLSADRAVAVCELLDRLGLSKERMGVAGFGAHQPVAPNITPADRRKNRRVELFVLAPDVPVIGWTETIPTVY